MREPRAAARPAPRSSRRAPRLLPRCAARRDGAEPPPQLQGRRGRGTPPPPAPRPDPAGRMEPPEGAHPGKVVKEGGVLQAPLGTSAPGPGDGCHSPVVEDVGTPMPAPGLLHVTERRQPLSSVSSLEVHFDLLDLTELTDMSDQELAEVFADSDDESSESPAGLQPLPRAGCLRSPSWTRSRAEQSHQPQPLSDPTQQPGMVDTLLTVEKPQD